jgi:hypothetical protein
MNTQNLNPTALDSVLITGPFVKAMIFARKGIVQYQNCKKRVAMLAIVTGITFLILPRISLATTYYVDSIGGADNNSGTSTSAPWQTIAKVNGSTFNPGDLILFKAGDTWRETTLIPPSSGVDGNLIMFASYGSGEKPQFNGSDLMTLGSAWSAYSRRIWYPAYTDAAAWGYDDNRIWNFRIKIPAGSSSYSGTRIRITIQAYAGHTAIISGSSIGPIDANGNFTSPPTRITWRGGNSGQTLINGASAVSDAITFTFDKTLSYGVHVFSTQGNFVSKSKGGTGMWYKINGATDDSFTEILSGYTYATWGESAAITELKVFSSPVNIWQALLPTQPNIVFFDGSLGDNRGSIYNLTKSNEWCWADNLLYTYSNTSPDSAYATIEIGGSRTGLYINNRSYLSFTNLWFTKGDYDGIELDNADHITFDNVDSTYNYLKGLEPYGDTADGSNNIVIRNGTFAYNGQSGVEFHGGGIGYIPQHDIIIEGNTVHDNGWQKTSGIYTSNIKVNGGFNIRGTTNSSYNVIIQGNSVYSISTLDRTASGVCIWLDQWGQGCMVRWNLVHDCQGYGIYFENMNGGIAFGNVLWNNATNSSDPNAANLQTRRGTIGTLLYNNTIYGGTIGIGVNGMGTDTTMVGNVVENNIVFGSKIRSFSATLGGENAGGGKDNVYLYNDFGPATSNFIEWGAGKYLSSYAAFDEAYSSSAHARGPTYSVAGSPQFTDASSNDFTLRPTSPVIDAGTNLGPSYQFGLSPASTWPGNIILESQDDNGSGWEMGAYVYPGLDPPHNLRIR